MRALTIKEEKFCQEYILDGNASRAYREAYNAENMKHETVNVKACNLLKKDKVAVRVKELRDKAQKRHDITVDDLVKELEEARIMASTQETAQTSAMIAATLGKAKLLGLVVDKTDVTTKGKQINQWSVLPVTTAKND